MLRCRVKVIVALGMAVVLFVAGAVSAYRSAKRDVETAAVGYFRGDWRKIHEVHATFRRVSPSPTCMAWIEFGLYDENQSNTDYIAYWRFMPWGEVAFVPE